MNVTFMKRLPVCCSVSCLLYLEETFKLAGWSLVFKLKEVISVELDAKVRLAFRR